MTTYTKKDLEAHFKIADTTVYRTLKACGLDTSRRSYTSEEIANYFIPARELFNCGYTFKQVLQYFTLKPTYHEDQERLTSSVRPQSPNS